MPPRSERPCRGAPMCAPGGRPVIAAPCWCRLSVVRPGISVTSSLWADVADAVRLTGHRVAIELEDAAVAIAPAPAESLLAATGALDLDDALEPRERQGVVVGGRQGRGPEAAQARIARRVLGGWSGGRCWSYRSRGKTGHEQQGEETG